MSMQAYLSDVRRYVDRADWTGVPGWQRGAPTQVVPLAQGEYNINYRVTQGGTPWVLRVNLGTQIGRSDQIAYEYGALSLLEPSGVTPRPYYLDDTRTQLDHGLLVMEYLPGEPLDYARDLEHAAQLFARLHGLPVTRAPDLLIRESNPLSSTLAECVRLAQVYIRSELADPFVSTYLAHVLQWAEQARTAEAYFAADPYDCIINTEVNSGNFIANRATGTLHLVDWEKPLWGDPSQDLSHFSVPTTTLWKTDYAMSERDRDLFLGAYRVAIPDRHLQDTIVERVRLRDPFNCLRGISWSAMAWVAYQSGQHALKNPDTFAKIGAYLRPEFLRRLFDPYLRSN